jgi:predicted glycoside hydrolase/deacetylase ChbG (UPF0249 family)
VAAERFLIFNADDFGLSEGTNRGIIEAHERGIVTSASLMVRQPGAEQAAAYAKVRAQLSVGLHVDLGEWVFRNGEWQQAYEVVPGDDFGAVAEEVERQLSTFRQLLGRDPTHVDSHQHVHKHDPARAVLLRVTERLGVPLRHFSQVAFCGSFYGQDNKGVPFADGLKVENLLQVFKELPAGITEIGCHPGLDAGLASSYRTEREAEVTTLCDLRLRSELAAEGITLISYAELPTSEAKALAAAVEKRHA